MCRLKPNYLIQYGSYKITHSFCKWGNRGPETIFSPGYKLSWDQNPICPTSSTAGDIFKHRFRKDNYQKIYNLKKRQENVGIKVKHNRLKPMEMGNK